MTDNRPLFLDVDGVLIDGYHARPAQLQHRWDERLQADLGVDPQRFRTEFIYGTFVQDVIVGKRALVDALDEALPSMGYNGSPMDFVQYWLANDSQVNEPLLAAIQRIRKAASSPFYIATNQEHLRAHWLWQTLGFNDLFDDIFYSARLGVKKPDPAYFAAVEQRAGPFTAQPLFFDDTPAVVEAARAAGWEAVLFETEDDFTRHPWVAERLG